MASITTHTSNKHTLQIAELNAVQQDHLSKIEAMRAVTEKHVSEVCVDAVSNTYSSS
jgi:hypothetical protein